VNRSLRTAPHLAALAICLALGGCITTSSVPAAPEKDRLPDVPGDISRCFNGAAVGNVPDRDLTVEEVERLWKSDRVRAVVSQRCGKRFVAWYGDLRAGWH
jgi:hypothetical protein